MEVFLILVLLALSAFFTGAEVAFVVVNRLKTEVRARREGRAGRVVSGFLERPDTFLSTTLAGNTLVLVLFSILTALALQAPLEAFWTRTLGFTAGTIPAVLLLQTLIASTLVLVFGELLPRSILREQAGQAVFVLARPLRIASYLLLPLANLAGGIASVLVRLFRSDAESFGSFMRRRAFEVAVRESTESGELELDDEGGELLSNVFMLSTIRAKESMVPRTDIEAVEETASIEEVRERFIRSGHSKLPVYRENIDNIVGVVFSYDLFLHPGSLAEILRPIRFIPESKPSRDLLREFLETKTSIAVVIDEYGGTGGLITTEDVLEELFGDIRDEFDTEDVVLRQINEHTFVVSGRADIEALEERFDIRLPEGDYETVAGLLLEHLGTIPTPNEEHVIAGYRFIILKASTNRVDLIKIIRA